MRRSTRNLAVATTALACLWSLAGCAGSRGGSTGSGAVPPSASSSVTGRITVLAAASLTEAFSTLGARFEAAHPGTRVTFSFGASSTLATQITQGAPADVFAAASRTTMDQVVSAKAAANPVTFARNTMEIAVPPGNPARIAGVADLARPGVKVVLCAPVVPCGATAQRVLANAGIRVRPVSEEIDVKSTLSKVVLAEADAAIVYVTDVRAAGPKVLGVPIPDHVNASTDYPIAILSGTRNIALASAFVDYVRSAEGAGVLTADGFSRPAPS